MSHIISIREYMVILTSKGFQNEDILKEIQSNKNNTIKTACIITSAAIPLKENGPNTKKAYEYIREKITKEIDFIDVEICDPQQLLKYDLVYITGGNSNHLFSVIQRSGADKVLMEIISSGKTVIGSSAGAMLLTSGNKYNIYFNKILNIEEKSDHKFSHSGLKITKHILLPHYDRFILEYPDLEFKIKDLEKRDNIKITRMNDNGYIIIKDNGEIIEKLT
jgi:peptidase E